MTPEELAKLQDEAAKYRWLLQHHPFVVAAAAWSVRAACECSEPDEAMSVAVQHKPERR